MGRLGLVAVAVILLVGGVTQGSTISRYPPLFEDRSPPLLENGAALIENPNVRGIETRVDEVDYRLPNNTVPSHYDVTITTNVHSGDVAFQGVAVITLTAVEELNENIVLHTRQLEIVDATLVDNVTGLSTKLNPSYESPREFLTLTPEDNSELVQGREYKLTIEYTGQLRTDNGGFYLSTYTNAAGQTVNLATTQFESTDARHGFPCYDEPAKRAAFTITINHDPSLNAISNMPVDTDKSSAGVTVFQETPKMPTYLVAYIISDFEYVSGSLNGFTQRIFSRPGTQADGEFALFTGIQTTARLADYYGVPFTLPKLDQVAVPDFAAGAMENWGIATYREEYMLYNPQTSTTSTQTNIANIIAHEYTHMWFGDLVTIRWWTYLWLKEGFATIFSYKILEEVYPEWDMMQVFLVSQFQGALTYDSREVTRALSSYVQTPSEISSIYDSVSYNKGGAVLYMWQNALTDDIFRAGLNNYLTLNEFTGAEEDDLFDGIQLAAKEVGYELADTIKVMMGSWTDKGGVPLLTVKRNYDDGSFTITQNSFYSDSTLSDDGLWYIPVNYVTKTNSDYRDTKVQVYLKNERSIVVTEAQVKADDWLILNKQSTGYYRIQYDDENWDLITEGLIETPYKIHPNNRAALLFDAYRLSASSQLKHSILLKLMTYLEREDQYSPWSTAYSILSTFNTLLSGDEDYPKFQAYVADLVNNIFERLGVNDVTGEQHLTKFVRSNAINLACLAGIPSCLEETNNKLKEVVSGTKVEPNLQSVTYCNGLKQTGDNEFNFLYNLLMTSDDQAERRVLISSLGCAQDRNHINKFIESSISGAAEVTLRVQERTTLLAAAYQRGEVGLLASIDFLSDNYEEYANLTSGFGGSNPLDVDIRGISVYVVNEEQETKLLALVAKVKDHPQLSATLETAVQANIKVNFDWLTTNRDPIMTWISDYNRSGASSVFTSLVPAIVATCYVLVKFF